MQFVRFDGDGSNTSTLFVIGVVLLLVLSPVVVGLGLRWFDHWSAARGSRSAATGGPPPVGEPFSPVLIYSLEAIALICGLILGWVDIAIVAACAAVILTTVRRRSSRRRKEHPS